MRSKIAAALAAIVMVVTLAIGVHSASAQATPPTPTGGGSGCRIAGREDGLTGWRGTAVGRFFTTYRATVAWNRPWFLVAPGVPKSAPSRR